MSTIASLRVASADTAAGFIRINRVDFDPRIHTLHESETEPRPTNEEVADNLAADRGGSDKYGKPRTQFEISRTEQGHPQRPTSQVRFEERRAAILAELQAL